MSAVAEVEEQEQLVAQPRSVTTFLAKRQNLRLVRKPRRHVRNADGEVVDERPGQTVPFVVFIDPIRFEQLVTGGMDPREAQAAARYGRFECPTEGTVTLEAGEEADAAEIHAWLMKHRLNGDSQEGFWPLVATAPPVSQDELNRLMEAALADSEDMLVAIIEQERVGWARDEVLTAAQGALERRRAMLAGMETEQPPEGDPEG